MMKMTEIDPMLLTEVEDDKVLDDTGKIFQEKHNGARAIVHVQNGRITAIRGRSNNPLLYMFPELREVDMGMTSGILDGELCVMKDGKSVFYGGIDKRRSIPSAKVMQEYPVRLIVFDALKINGEVLVYVPYEQRLKVLKDQLRESTHVVLIDSTCDGRSLWNKVVAENREGVVIKDPRAIYEIGKRSKAYLKLKNYKIVDVKVEKTEVNEKGTKIFSNIELDGKPIKVECQQAGCFNIHAGDTVRVKYLDVVGDHLVQPTRS